MCPLMQAFINRVNPWVSLAFEWQVVLDFYFWDTLRFVGVKKEWPHHIDQDDDVVGDLIITSGKGFTAYWHFFSLQVPSLSARAKAP